MSLHRHNTNQLFNVARCREARSHVLMPSLRVDDIIYKDQQMSITNTPWLSTVAHLCMTPKSAFDLRKDDYLAADSKEGRNQVLKEMLAAIFNYWTSQGQAITNPEQTSKVCWISAPASYILPVPQNVIAWVRNTWRLPKCTTSAPKVQINVRLTSALWLTRQKDVQAEIASLLGVPEATTTTPGWLGARMTAMGNILAWMSPEEKAALEQECERISREGHLEDLRQKYVRCCPAQQNVPS